MKQSAGFTLIELIAVILILGILAVTAAPQFLDLSSSARTAAVTGVAGALGSASAMNYARRSLSSADGVTVGNCNVVANALAGGSTALPTGYSVGSVAIANGASATCVLTGPNAVTASFVGLGIT